MLWKDSEENDRFIVPDAIVDLSFRFQCAADSNAIAVDHGLMLRDAITDILPWLSTEPTAAIHRIYGAATGNGWTRPKNENGSTMEVSKRTRLVIRLPKEKLTAAQKLEGCAFQMGDQQIIVGKAAVKPLVATRTLFCRSLITDSIDDEDRFTTQLVEDLDAMQIPVTKLLCGKTHQLVTDQGESYGRSVMLAELTLENAVKLQQRGLGNHKLLGCGIFLPHKGIGAVGSSQDDA